MMGVGAVADYVSLREGPRRATFGAVSGLLATAAGREDLSQKSQRELELLDGTLVKPITASMLHDAVVEAWAQRGCATRTRAALPGSRRLAGLRLLVVWCTWAEASAATSSTRLMRRAARRDGRCA